MARQRPSRLPTRSGGALAAAPAQRCVRATPACLHVLQPVAQPPPEAKTPASGHRLHSPVADPAFALSHFPISALANHR